MTAVQGVIVVPPEDFVVVLRIATHLDECSTVSSCKVLAHELVTVTVFWCKLLFFVTSKWPRAFLQAIEAPHQDLPNLIQGLIGTIR